MKLHIHKISTLLFLFIFSNNAIADSALCDLTNDKCGGKELTKNEFTKSMITVDLVAKKLLDIEANEKAKGNDFKVAIISRMGSDLTRFNPLIETDKSGNILKTKSIIESLVSATDLENRYKEGSSFGSDTNKISYSTMLNNLDSKRKIKYSHMAIALKNVPVYDAKTNELLTHPDKGQWSVFQLLYSCEDKHVSYVYMSNLRFFLNTDMFDYSAQIIVPTKDLQDNIENLVLNRSRSSLFLQKQYNAAALPYDLNQQNSNQWVLEVLAASLNPNEKVRTRGQAQEVLRKTNYFPSRITTVGLAAAVHPSLLGKVLNSIMPTVCFKSQPNIVKYGVGEIITALSVEEYLMRLNKVEQVHEVTLDKDTKNIVDKYSENENKQQYGQ